MGDGPGESDPSASEGSPGHFHGSIGRLDLNQCTIFSATYGLPDCLIRLVRPDLFGPRLRTDVHHPMTGRCLEIFTTCTALATHPGLPDKNPSGEGFVDDDGSVQSSGQNYHGTT